jgi:hypothetical protein
MASERENEELRKTRLASAEEIATALKSDPKKVCGGQVVHLVWLGQKLHDNRFIELACDHLGWEKEKYMF